MYNETKMLSEAVVQRCSVKKVFLDILQNSQENTCAGVSFLINLMTIANITDFKNVVSGLKVKLNRIIPNCRSVLS